MIHSIVLKNKHYYFIYNSINFHKNDSRSLNILDYGSVHLFMFNSGNIIIFTYIIFSWDTRTYISAILKYVCVFDNYCVITHTYYIYIFFFDVKPTINRVFPVQFDPETLLTCMQLWRLKFDNFILLLLSFYLPIYKLDTHFCRKMFR